MATKQTGGKAKPASTPKKKQEKAKPGAAKKKQFLVLVQLE